MEGLIMYFGYTLDKIKKRKTNQKESIQSVRFKDSDINKLYN